MKFELNENDLASTVMELRAGLHALNPETNVKGFVWEGSIAAGVDFPIPNKMRNGEIPIGFIVLNCTPLPTLAKGSTAWDSRQVWLRNVASTSTVTAKVLFYK